MDDVRERFEQAGQGHVFAWWDRLDESQREQLTAQAKAIDLDELDRLVNQLLRGTGEGQGPDLSRIEPAPYEPLPAHGGDPARWREAADAGEDILRAGRVAAFVVAGGQGTRLGFDGPKGTFPVTPVRQRPLFAVLAGKIRAASHRYGVRIPWMIMTSPANHEATVQHFEQNALYGLDREDLFFFPQGTMPAVDPEGRIILSAPSEIATSPDGHGGSLRALHRCGALKTLRERGIDTISYFQVDNPLVRCIDPAFIGFHHLGQSDMSSKAVPKAYPKEKLGHFCLEGGRLIVVEYSDMPDALTQATLADGQLRFRAGSIAIHIIDRDFAERLGRGEDPALRLPFHRAHKKIPTVDKTGQTIKPEAPNGYKFEMFVFDALPFARQPVVIETARQDDFSPVKNAEGVDSPQTARDDQLRQFARWARAAGLHLRIDDTGLPDCTFEIDPLFADNQDAFIEAWNALPEKERPTLQEGTVLDPAADRP